MKTCDFEDLKRAAKLREEDVQQAKPILLPDLQGGMKNDDCSKFLSAEIHVKEYIVAVMHGKVSLGKA